MNSCQNVFLSNCYATKDEKNKDKILLKKGTCIIAEIDNALSEHTLKNVNVVKCPTSTK